MNRTLGRRIAVLVLAAAVRLPVAGQTPAAATLDCYMDFARFDADADFECVELYFGVPRDGLRYAASDGKLRAVIRFDLKVLAADSTVLSRTWERQDQVESTAVIQPGQMLQDIHEIYLRPGRYRIRATVSDPAGMKARTREFPMECSARPEGRVSLSDVQLATLISRDTTANRFTKNGYRVLPNPGCVYGVAMPVCYYYAELYGLSPLAAGTDSTVAVSVSIFDSQDRIAVPASPRRMRRAGASLVEAGGLPVGSLRTGTYRLRVAVSDPATGDSAFADKTFYVYRVQDVAAKAEERVERADPTGNEFLVMDEKACDLHFGYLKYILARNESKIFKKLNLEGKRRFLRDFWIQRNAEASDAGGIPFKDVYYDRIRLANERYTGAMKDGWKTDRGRVLMVYGEPDDIKRSTMSDTGDNYEIWRFDKVEGGTEFVFVDESGYGDYRLVHSTVMNEIHDTTYDSLLN
jgi:GWxTD domain-containing protein